MLKHLSTKNFFKPPFGCSDRTKAIITNSSVRTAHYCFHSHRTPSLLRQRYEGHLDRTASGSADPNSAAEHSALRRCCSLTVATSMRRSETHQMSRLRHLNSNDHNKDISKFVKGCTRSGRKRINTLRKCQHVHVPDTTLRIDETNPQTYKNNKRNTSQ